MIFTMHQCHLHYDLPRCSRYPPRLSFSDMSSECFDAGRLFEIHTRADGRIEIATFNDREMPPLLGTIITISNFPIARNQYGDI